MFQDASLWHVGAARFPVTVVLTSTYLRYLRSLLHLQAGGSVTCVYHGRVGLHAELKPENFLEGRPLPRRARPPPKKMPYYLSWENRGEFAIPVASASPEADSTVTAEQ